MRNGIDWIQLHFTTDAQRRAFDASRDLDDLRPLNCYFSGPSIMARIEGVDRIIGHMETTPGALPSEIRRLLTERSTAFCADECMEHIDEGHQVRFLFACDCCPDVVVISR